MLAYVSAERSISGIPGFDFKGLGRGSNRVAAKYVIHEIQVDAKGKIEKFVLEFKLDSEE